MDVTVTQFAVARARKHNQQEAEHEGPQSGTRPIPYRVPDANEHDRMVFASQQAAIDLAENDPFCSHSLKRHFLD